jgi:proteasome assembly chaperone (PAC2) family protein
MPLLVAADAARVVVRVCATMAAVQEQMQHGTQEEQHIRQDIDNVGTMFQYQEERRDSQEGEEDQSAWRSEPAAFL